MQRLRTPLFEYGNVVILGCYLVVWNLHMKVYMFISTLMLDYAF